MKKNVDSATTIILFINIKIIWKNNVKKHDKELITPHYIQRWLCDGIFLGSQIPYPDFGNPPIFFGVYSLLLFFGIFRKSRRILEFFSGLDFLEKFQWIFFVRIMHAIWYILVGWVIRDY